MLKPSFEIRMVKENLDLAVAVMQAVEKEKVTARQLFRDGPEAVSYTHLTLPTSDLV